MTKIDFANKLKAAKHKQKKEENERGIEEREHILEVGIGNGIN